MLLSNAMVTHKSQLTLPGSMEYIIKHRPMNDLLQTSYLLVLDYKNLYLGAYSYAKLFIGNYNEITSPMGAAMDHVCTKIPIPKFTSVHVKINLDTSSSKISIVQVIVSAK